MNALLAKIEAFVKDEEGLTVVEYAVAGGLIAAAVVIAFTALGRGVQDRINGLTCAVTGGTWADGSVDTTTGVLTPGTCT